MAMRKEGEGYRPPTWLGPPTRFYAVPSQLELHANIVSLPPLLPSVRPWTAKAEPVPSRLNRIDAIPKGIYIASPVMLLEIMLQQRIGRPIEYTPRIITARRRLSTRGHLHLNGGRHAPQSEFATYAQLVLFCAVTPAKHAQSQCTSTKHRNDQSATDDSTSQHRSRHPLSPLPSSTIPGQEGPYAVNPPVAPTTSQRREPQPTLYRKIGSRFPFKKNPLKGQRGQVAFSGPFHDFGQHPLESPAIGVRREDVSASIRSIENVMDQPSRHISCGSRHGPESTRSPDCCQ